MKVFIDANILIDILNSSRVFHEESVKAYKYLIETEANIYSSCDLITTVYYIEAKENKKRAILGIKNILITLNLVEFSNKEVELACNLMLQDNSYRDLEDTLQYILAKKMECDLILSNDKNFVGRDIEILSSKEFCKRFNL